MAEPRFLDHLRFHDVPLRRVQKPIGWQPTLVVALIFGAFIAGMAVGCKLLPYLAGAAISAACAAFLIALSIHRRN